MTTLPSRILALKFFLTPKNILLSFGFAFIFFLVASILANIKNVASIISSPFELAVKLKLLGIILFEGTFTTMGILDGIFLLIISLLFGLSLSLILTKLSAIKKRGKLSVIFGTGVFSIISAGCASCGLSAASLLGLGGAFAFLPFHGLEFYVLSLIVLLISLWVNLGAYAKTCSI